MASVKKTMKVLQDWKQVQEEEKPLAQIIKEQKRSKSLSEKAAAQYQEITTEQKNEKETKKHNKKAPREVTTDKPVSRFRKINMPFKVRSQLKRDPRFDNLSGNFNQDLFHKSYKFLEKQLQADIENFNGILQKLNQEQNGDNEEEIRGIEIQIRKLKQQQSQLSNFKLEQGVKKKIKNEEEEAIKQGKKPFFLKKNILKKTILKQKFLDLEKKGKLDKYIIRKKQKIDSKSIKEKNSLINQ